MDFVTLRAFLQICLRQGSSSRAETEVTLGVVPVLRGKAGGLRQVTIGAGHVLKVSSRRAKADVTLGAGPVLKGEAGGLKPVLNWVNVCSPKHTSNTSTNYESFLN